MWSVQNSLSLWSSKIQAGKRRMAETKRLPPAPLSLCGLHSRGKRWSDFATWSAFCSVFVISSKTVKSQTDMLMYSLAVTVWINFFYLWKACIKLTLALAFIIHRLHSQIHGISSVQHRLPFQPSCVTAAGMPRQSWLNSTLQIWEPTNHDSFASCRTQRGVVTSIVVSSSPTLRPV